MRLSTKLGNTKYILSDFSDKIVGVKVIDATNTQKELYIPKNLILAYYLEREFQKKEDEHTKRIFEELHVEVTSDD